MNTLTKTKEKSKHTPPITCLLGDNVRFKRRGLIIEGVVEKIRENSVLVKISLLESRFLDLENQLTVVSHKHYEVV